MESFLIFIGIITSLVFIIIPIVLLVMVSGLKSQMTLFNQRLMHIYQEITQVKQLLDEHKVVPEHEPEPEISVEKVIVPEKPEREVSIRDVPDVVAHAVQEVQEAISPEEILITDDTTANIEEEYTIQTEEEVVPEVVAEAIPEAPSTESIDKEEVIENTSNQHNRVGERPIGNRPPRQPKESFNFERFIGENLINKIGIAVLVIGIGLLVKYAIDNNWINEAARVLIGFLCGSALLALAYKFRKAYRAFSSVLAGGGITVFYFTVGIAFREYGMFGQSGSFMLMVAITSFSVWLSILYDRRELAILPMIGGFLTPFIVSRGDGNYHVLFIYLAILNVGMLTLSLRKQWKELLVIGFTGTQLIFWIYNAQHLNGGYAQDVALFCYVSAFYIIFLMMPLIQVFRANEKLKDYSVHVIILIANSFLYLLAGIILLNRIGAGESKGLLSGILAVVNALIALMLYQRKKDELFLRYLFIGLVISFVTLTAPLQFNGNYITLFWATEAVLLSWLFYRSSDSTFYYSSLLLLACTFISMMMDINTQHNLVKYAYDSTFVQESKIFINQYFITRLYATLAFLASGIILRKYCNMHQKRSWGLPSWFPTAIGVLATILLFYTGYRELGIYTINFTPYWCAAYTLVYLLIQAAIVGRHSETCRYRLYAVISLWAVSCLYYWMQIRNLNWAREGLVAEHLYGTLPVMLYWIAFVGLCGLFVLAARCFYRQYTLKSSSGKNFMWLFNIAAVLCLSFALLEALAQIGTYFGISFSRSSKTGITILWSLCAFVQMWIGMHFKNKTLRVISLSLLAVVLFKLFIYDLSNASQGAKIVAFVVLGIVLLVLSFLYQKLKKILFEDEDKEEGN